MKYHIPLFDLNFDGAEERAVIECLRSKWISTGPRTLEFEQRFSELSGGVAAVALANCTVALHLALLLAGINEDDEVICPSLTFVATVNAIRYVGAVPVFADIQGCDNLTIDPADVKRKITKRTKAIIVMHYAGFPCDMDRLMNLANDHGLKVIEDACHGPFSEYNGQKLGTIGDVGCFSFFSNKNISTGEGGMLVTRHPEYEERARLLRSHGMTSMSYQRAKGHSTSYDVVAHGYNYRMDDLRAAVGIAQLGKIPEDYLSRGRVRGAYLDRLAHVSSITVPFSNHSGYVSNYIFPIVLNEGGAGRRDAVREALTKLGVQTSVHYPPVHKFSIYRKEPARLPVTEEIAGRIITLPMYSSLSEENVEYVCNSLMEALNE